MKKIYIVTSGAYSDYSIDAVFTTKELAEKFIEKLDPEGVIEEWDLDMDLSILDHKKIYFVRMKKDGTIINISINEDVYSFKSVLKNEYGFDCESNLYMSVFANDENHAIKIVNEKRTQLIALNQWEDKEAKSNG